MMQVLVNCTAGDIPVSWHFDKATDSHVIVYGLSVNQYAGSLEAGREFGECVRHLLECAGKFDTEGI